VSVVSNNTTFKYIYEIYLIKWRNTDVFQIHDAGSMLRKKSAVYCLSLMVGKDEKEITHCSQ
jgi:hypothetical protein